MQNGYEKKEEEINNLILSNNIFNKKMLVFSKMKKLLKNNNLLQMYDFIPKDLQDEFHRRSQNFIKQNSLKAWKDFLKSWYKKEDSSRPKHIGDYFKSMFRHIRDVNKGLSKKKLYYGKKKIKRKSKMKKEKISQSLKKKCKKLKVRLTMKRGGKRVYKSIKVLKRQCEKASKKRKRKFGAARKGGRIVPSRSHFGRPYLGYTVGGKVRFGSRRPEFHYPEHVLTGYNTAKTNSKFRFGSRRPEFHYPEHVLTGYNTAKTNKKFRFGRPHRHPLRYASYNPSKTGKKFRFGKPKKIKENRFRNFKKDPLTNEEFEFIKKFNSKINTKKKAIKYSLVFAKIGKRDLNTRKPLLTDEDKEYLIECGNSLSEINLHNWCGLNPVKCAAAGIGTAGLVGGALIGAAKYHDSYNDSNDDSKYLKRAMTQRTRNAASDYFSKYRSSDFDNPFYADSI